MTPAPRSRRQFTLIELLVVVAIIGVLAAMLLPALNKAREASRASACTSQIKQVVTGVMMYAQDWDDFAPPAYDATVHEWWINLDKYLVASPKPNETGRSPLLQCPSLGRNPVPGGTLSERFNRHIACNPNVIRHFTWNPGQKRISAWLRPQDLELYHDANMVYLWGDCFTWTDNPGSWYSGTGSAYDSTNGTALLPQVLNLDYPVDTAAKARFRHRNNQFCNFAFADGHAGQIQIGTLQAINVYDRWK